MKKIILIQLIVLIALFTNAQHLDTHAWFDASPKGYIDLGRGAAIQKISNLSSGNKITIAMWVKWGSKSASGVTKWPTLMTLADSTGSGDNGVFWLQHSSDNKKFEFAITTTVNGSSTREYIQSSTQPVEDVWYHIACVYDGSLINNNMKLYVNGQQESAKNKTGNVRAVPAASKLNIGRWANPTDSFRRFNGSIDEVIITNTALTSSQIGLLMQNADSFALTNSKATSVISYYNFESHSATDLAPNPNNGISYSGVSYLNSDASNLPIQLVEFSPKRNANTIDFSWKTASEINNDFFTLEKSIDGINFSEIARVIGAGNSNSLLNYSYSYNEFYDGTLYFRLKQTDFDGKFTYSQAVSVENSKMQEIKIYPNPISAGNNLTVIGLNNQISQIKLVDMSGIQIMDLKCNQNENLEIETSGLRKGMYVIHFISNKEITSKILTID